MIFFILLIVLLEWLFLLEDLRPFGGFTSFAFSCFDEPFSVGISSSFGVSSSFEYSPQHQGAATFDSHF